MEKRILINGEETAYTISELGQVFSDFSNSFLKPSVSQHGYLVVTLSHKKKKYRRYVHRLMGMSFLSLEEKDYTKVINHKDGNKQNNVLENLEVVTPHENLNHAYKNDLKKPNAKKTIPFSESLPNEEWKEISGFKGNYLISNLGRVQSKKYKNPILLRPDIRCGYYSVTLSLNGQTKHFLIHDLVYAAFCGSEDKGNKVIDHIDGNKLNNVYTNLRLITKSENSLLAFYTQRTNKNCKPVIMFKEGTFIMTFPSLAKAAEYIGSDSSTISKVCRGKLKTIFGYTFQYLE